MEMATERAMLLVLVQKAIEHVSRSVDLWGLLYTGMIYELSSV
jgi:hypothetical protein